MAARASIMRDPASQKVHVTGALPKNKNERAYLCIDLKSFYASVECVERGLDPMTTDLVVADPERGQGTICLAVSPSLKAKGVKNRCRLFEIPKDLDFIQATPRMQKYIEYSADIYGVYLDFFSKDDIYAYSIDEVFIDATDYLKLYQKSPRELAVFLMEEVKNRIGVRATAGVGTNLYLAKIALDIMAKHADDFVGVLDEKSYQDQLWDHQPLTDFWRIGPGIARRLAKHRMRTMRDIAHADEDILYQIFGVDAELLIDHAWGREPVTIADIKNYHSRTTSYSSGQVLPKDYSAKDTALVVREMMRELCLRLVENHQLVSSITLSIIPADLNKIAGKTPTSYTKFLKKATHKFISPTNSAKTATKAVDNLFWKIADGKQKYRRIFISCNNVISDSIPHQQSLFDVLRPSAPDEKIQEAVISIKNRYGKNAIFRGEDLEESATLRERNNQIGGHRSGD